MREHELMSDEEPIRPTGRGAEVVAAFDGVDEARAAAEELRTLGFPARVGLHPEGAAAEGESDEEWAELDRGWLRSAVRGALLGGLIGLVLGGLIGAGVAMASSTQAGLVFEVCLLVGLFGGLMAGGLVGGFRSVWRQSNRDVVVEGAAVVRIETSTSEAASRAYAIVDRRRPNRVDEFVEGERVRLDLSRLGGPGR